VADPPDGLLGRLFPGNDPAALYTGALTDPATQQQMATRGLLAMAGSFADSAMPTRMPTPLGAVLGHAAAAAGASGDAVMTARLQAAQSEQARAQSQLIGQRVDLLKGMGGDFQELDRALGNAAAGAPAPAIPGTVAPGTAVPVGKPPTGPIDPTLVTNAALEQNLDPLVAHTTMDIESSYGTNTGNKVSPSNTGAFQMAPADAPGGQNDTYENQVKLGTQALAQARVDLRNRLGREPTNAEVYLAHQQGPAGAAALINNPDTPAGKLVRPVNISNNGGAQFVNQPASAFVQHWQQEYAKREAKFATLAAPGPGGGAQPPGATQTAAAPGLLNNLPESRDPIGATAQMNAPIPGVAGNAPGPQAGLLGPPPGWRGPINVAATTTLPPGAAGAPLPPPLPPGAPPPGAAAPNLVPGGALATPPPGGPSVALQSPTNLQLPPPTPLVTPPPPGPAIPPVARPQPPPVAPPPSAALPAIPGAPSPQAQGIAARIAYKLTMAGMPVPSSIDAIAKFGLTAAQAAATAQATLPAEIYKAVAIANGTLPADIAKATAGPAERGVQARITAGDEWVNMPALGGWIQRKNIPGYTIAGAGGGSAPAPAGPGPGVPGPAPVAPGGGAPATGVPPPVPGAIPSETPAQTAFFADNRARAAEQLKPLFAERETAPATIDIAEKITDLLGQTKQGWGADTAQKAGMILRSLGVPEDKVFNFLGVKTTEGATLNKQFLQLSSAAVLELGKHEAGSVLSQFVNAYPSLESDPGAALLMTNALRMQAQWKIDRANAAETYERDQQANSGPFGQNYKGLAGFDAAFAKTNDVHDYWRAAAAVSGVQGAEPATLQKFSNLAWRGTSDADKQRIYDHIPAGRQFVGDDGKVYVKPPGAQ
jgi:hypothetical protein